MSKRKSNLVTVRALPSIAPQLADLMVTRLGLDAIGKAYKVDNLGGVFAIIRPELPAAITDQEVREIANVLNDKARELNAPLPFNVSRAKYDIFLPEDN